MVSWHAFFRAVSLHFSHDGRARDWPIISQGWSAIQAIENLRQLIATNHGAPDLLELLWACRNYRSTDPRDRIFALLGISNLLYGQGPQKQLGFEIDYTKSVAEIFQSFTISMIAKNYDLRVLGTRRPNRIFDDKDLGSWCPDWASLDDGVSLLYKQHQWSGNMMQYRACGDRTAFDAGSAQKRENLFLRGFKLDTIKSVRHTSHFDSVDARLYGWHHWAVWPDDRERTGTPRPAGEANQQRQDAFWRTVIADADANGNRHPIYLGNQFRKWYQKIVEGLDTSKDFTVDISAGAEYKEFVGRVRQVTKGRSLFETSTHGFLGIGDEDESAELGGPQLAAGDIVAILDGGPLPVMLRKVHGPPEMKCKSTYRLIGDAFCYVHGMVDGEALHLETETEEFIIV